MTMKRYIIPTLILALALVVFACSGTGGGNQAAAVGGRCNLGSNNVTSQQIALQCITGQYMLQTHPPGFFPLQNQQGLTAEMKNLYARDVRFSDPNKIGYLILLTANGQLIHQWTIRGKPSSTASELTNTENAIGRTGSGSDVGGTVVSSPGDDGTFGPEECGTQGIFFFSADTDAMQEVCAPGGIWWYSDAPITTASIPLVVANVGMPTTPIPAGGSATKITLKP